MSGLPTRSEIEELLEIAVLASWSKMDKRSLRRMGPIFQFRISSGSLSLSAFSESIRTLRSGILMSDVDQPPKVIQVTSSCPSEGKSTIAVSFAISAAVQGRKWRSWMRTFAIPRHRGFSTSENNKGLG